MRIPLILLAILVPAFSASAQYFNPNSFCNDLEISAGFQGDFKSGEGVGARIDMTYGHFFRNGIGFRAGMCYMPDNVSIEHAAGIPLAFAWRSRIWGYEDTYIDAARNALTSDNNFFEEPDYYDDDYSLTRDLAEHAVSSLGTFLANLVSRVELFGGVTPGYIFGEDNLHQESRPDINFGEYYLKGIVVPHSFFLSIDAGVKLVIRVWRLSIDITPAVHYYVTDNFRTYNPLLKEPLSKPIRWQMSLRGGLGIMF